MAITELCHLMLIFHFMQLFFLGEQGSVDHETNDGVFSRDDSDGPVEEFFDSKNHQNNMNIDRSSSVAKEGLFNLDRPYADNRSSTPPDKNISSNVKLTPVFNTDYEREKTSGDSVSLYIINDDMSNDRYPTSAGK